ncbi:MAG TPA: hypothetical protein VL651_08250 [Bacteroidia bacterium]|jgi:hypothetical protein|nr:hypothetical protein [Bacteroidia bacterium]
MRKLFFLFLIMFVPDFLSAQTGTANVVSTDSIVKRDTSQTIIFRGDTIFQDGKKIGYVVLSDPGPPAYYFSFYDARHNEVATAVEIGPVYYEIDLLNGKTKSHIGVKNADDPEEELVRYFIRLGYL